MKIVTLIVQLIAVSAGALGGLWLKSKEPQKAPVSHASDDHKGAVEKSSHDAKADKKSGKKKKKKSSHGGHGGKGSESDSGFGYVKFSRQFIVPVIASSSVKSLAVLDISLEVPSSSTESVYSREPKLRDVMLSAMLMLSSEKKFSGDFLDPENIEIIRERLLSSAKTVLEDDVHNVLILSISRQDL